MKLKFSIYYRIQNRDKFFESFFSKIKNKFDTEIVDDVEDKYSELLEIIVKMLLDFNYNDLLHLLTKTNAKIARIFFDYLTCSNIKNKKKTEIILRLNEIFWENKMINFKEYLDEKLTPIDFSDLNEKVEKIKLNEADDEDPFADDGGDEGGDPFGDDAGGDEGGSDDAGDEADGEGGEEESEEKEEINFDEWEDDPDFTKGTENKDDITLSDSPAGQVIYDVDGIMKSINAVIQSTSEEDLAEINQVKQAVELIFNGKLLKPEDVTFQNPKNASFLIKKIGENVDEKTKNYMILKIKTPLIQQRDQQKLDIANLKKDVSGIRDTLDVLN